MNQQSKAEEEGNKNFAILLGIIIFIAVAVVFAWVAGQSHSGLSEGISLILFLEIIAGIVIGVAWLAIPFFLLWIGRKVGRIIALLEDQFETNQRKQS